MKARLERLRKYTPQRRINYPAQPGVASTNEGGFEELRFEQRNTSYEKYLTRYVSRNTETSHELYDNDDIR